MTQIAVDWQVHAGDGRYYDVIFVGTGEFIFTEHFSLVQTQMLLLHGDLTISKVF